MQGNVTGAIEISDRRRIALKGVKDVSNFDESMVCLETNLGSLVLKGEGLHITQLDLESENVLLEGKFNSLEYVEDFKGKQKNRSIIKRILK